MKTAQSRRRIFFYTEFRHNVSFTDVKPGRDELHSGWHYAGVAYRQELTNDLLVKNIKSE